MAFPRLWAGFTTNIIFNPPHSKAFNTFILKSQKTEIMCINYLSIHIISLI